MNKNDKFHGAEFEVNAQAISDEQLEGVSGGNSYDGRIICPYCGMLVWVAEFYSSNHQDIGKCVSDVQNS